MYAAFKCDAERIVSGKGRNSDRTGDRAAVGSRNQRDYCCHGIYAREICVSSGEVWRCAGV